MIQFLKKLLTDWVRSVPNPEPTVTVESDEAISRFLTSKSMLAKTKGSVKYGAYLPNRNGETSVYRVSGITKEEILEIGEKYVRMPIAKNRGSCSIHGWAEVEAYAILGSNLTIEPKPKPHPRHADIENWPSEKPKRQMLATEIANKAILHLPSNPLVK